MAECGGFTPVEVERVQGFPDNWTLPRDIDEKQAERIDSLRYHAIGNAVSPPVAEWAGMRLATVMAEQDLESSRNGLHRTSFCLGSNGRIST